MTGWCWLLRTPRRPTCSPKEHTLQRKLCPGNMALVNTCSYSGSLTSLDEFFNGSFLFFPFSNHRENEGNCLHTKAVLCMNSAQAGITALCSNPVVCSFLSPCLTRTGSFSKLPVLFMASMRAWWENVDLCGHTCPEKSLLSHLAHAWIRFPAELPHPQKPVCRNRHLPLTEFYLGHARLRPSTHGQLIRKSPLES